MGHTKDILDFEPKEANYFAYKRINHFNEWLAQFQAKETTEIPDNIYRDIYHELRKNINLEFKDVNYKLLRSILKNLKYNKYLLLQKGKKNYTFIIVE